MAPKPLPDHPAILEALFNEAKHYLEDFGPISNKLLILERDKQEPENGSVRTQTDLEYEKATITDLNRRLAAAGARMNALQLYLERDLFADMEDISQRMGGADPNSNPKLTAIHIILQTLDKVRVLYNKIIFKLENQKAALPASQPGPPLSHQECLVESKSAPRSEESKSSATSMTPSMTKAYQSFKQVIDLYPWFFKDKEVYKFLLDNGSEIYDDGLPDFETWTRYLRQARKFLGTQKNTPRGGRPHGKSIVDSKQE